MNLLQPEAPELSAAPPTSRARAATIAMFFTNGLAIASIAPRYPEIKAALELSNTAYGLAIATVPLGALAIGWLAGKAVRRFGDAHVAVFGTALMALAAWAATLAPNLILFVLPLLVMGGLDAIVDVAMNTHGFRVQRVAKRTLINSFHAFWSLGVVAGGLIASLALSANISRSSHLAVIAIVITAIALVAFVLRLPSALGLQEHVHQGRGRSSSAVPLKVWLILAGLSVLGIGACLVEDLGPSWSTEYLGASLGATPAVAPLGYVAFMAAEFVSRFTGDRLVDRFGQRAVALSGSLLATIGLSLAIAFPSVVGTIAGFAVAGFGIATLGPLAMEATDNLPHLPQGTGLTITSWLLRFGFLVSPPLVGFIADHSSIRLALIVYPSAALLVALLARLLPARAPH